MTQELSRPCKEWTGARFSNGYGHVVLAGVNMTVHRVEFIVAIGDPGPELVIDHRCNNRLCYEITHLQALTTSQNIRRAFVKCRRGLHEYTPENTAIRSGRRSCRACERDRRREFKETHPTYFRDWQRVHHG